MEAKVHPLDTNQRAAIMKHSKEDKRRPKLQITLARASRLYRLVGVLDEANASRERLLTRLGFGLRTFYRELELLKKCGIKVKQTGKVYELQSESREEAQGHLPFPDPQLSFADMAELSSYPGSASKRLGKLLESVVNGHATAKAKKKIRTKAEADASKSKRGKGK